MKGFSRFLFSVFVVLLGVIALSSQSWSAPFTDKKSSSKIKKDKVKLTPEEERVLGTFESNLSRCVEKKKDHTDKQCVRQYPYVGKGSKKSSTTDSKRTFGLKMRLSREAKECMTFYENQAGIQCVSLTSKGLPPRVYSYWYSKNGNELEKLKAKQKKYSIAAEASSSASGTESGEWVKEFD